MRLSSAKRFRLRATVGLKVAAMVIVFETVMLVAYALISQFLLDEQDIGRFLELKLNNQNIVAITIVASFVLAGYLTYTIITRIFNPVDAIMSGTDEVIKGNLDHRLEVRTGDELQLLAERFNIMAAALKVERETLERKVTERTNALQAVQSKELERQKEILHLKDEFLFVAAHELRTPVAAIRWSLESVADQKMHEDVRQAVDDAMTSARNLATLVEDLLNMARLDAKSIPFKKEAVNVHEAAQQVAKEIEGLAAARGVRILVEPADRLGLAYADERRVYEVLMNLVSNAVKYNRKGGSVAVRMTQETDRLRFDVADDGPGIPPEDQKHVFEKFWRAPTTGGVEGSGLGLFIVKRLVEGMNGIVSFESVPDKGTTFSVRLPLAQG